MENKKRLVNFEILRCVLMLMVVYVHFFLGGVVMHSSCYNIGTPFGVINYTLSEVIYTLCMTAVNMFVFITGYFMVETHHLSLKKMLKLWIPVCFYTVVFAIMNFHSGGVHDLLKAFLPIRAKEYWFVNNYFGIVLLAPFLAKITAGISRKGYVLLLIVLAFLTLDIYRFPYGDIYDNHYGNSLLFFVFLFYVGGFFRKYGDMFPLKYLHLKSNWHLLALTFFVVLLYGICKGFDWKSGKAMIEVTPYHSFSFLLSVAVFQFFLRLQIPDNNFTKLCCKIAPYTFAVYLIHENHIVKGLLWNKWIVFDGTTNEPFYLLLLGVVPIAIYLVCVVIEYTRVKLFQIFGLSKIIDKLDCRIKIW